MAETDAFWQMGGYANYVWPAYTISIFVLLVLLFQSWRKMKRVERAVAASNMKPLQDLAASSPVSTV